MKQALHDRIDDYGSELQQEVERRLGGELMFTGADQTYLPAMYRDCVPYARVPGALVIPVRPNIPELRHQTGTVFAVKTTEGLYPAVVTDQSTDQSLVLARLNTAADKLDLSQLVGPAERNADGSRLSLLQQHILRQAAVLQAAETGSGTYDQGAPGREIGHTVLGMGAVLRPEFVTGGHAVHSWADSQQGVGGTVTARQGIRLFDVQTADGVREIGYAPHVQTDGFLLQVPGVEIGNIVSSPDRFTLGLGMVALEGRLRDGHSSVLGTGTLRNRIMDTLERM